MLTPSVNSCSRASRRPQEGEIWGLSRCVSNLGSSLGTAIAGTILFAGQQGWYIAGKTTLVVIGPRRSRRRSAPASARGPLH